ncbi:MAG: 50S ribosomal protein L1 [Mycoplasma sp.]
MRKISKKMQKAYAQLDPKKIYPIEEAVKLAQSTSITKFEGSIDVAIKLNLDTTKAEQQLRGTFSFPHSNGKVLKILALSDDISEADAKAAGADFFGGVDMISEIEKGFLGYDVILTTPKMMPALSKLGKVLGPRGLMPNPKTGTVSQDLIKTIKEFKLGKYEYRTDTYGNIHMTVGKVSSKTSDVVENITSLVNLLKSKRPSTVKGNFIQNISVTSTMGPGFKIVITN